MVDMIDINFFISIFEIGEPTEIPILSTISTKSTESTEKFVKITFINHHEQNLENDLLNSSNKLVLYVKVWENVTEDKIKDVVIIKEQITTHPLSFCSTKTAYVCSNDFSSLYKYLCYQCIDDKYEGYIYYDSDKNYADHKNDFLKRFHSDYYYTDLHQTENLHHNIDCVSYRIVLDEASCKKFEDQKNITKEEYIDIERKDEKNTSKNMEAKNFTQLTSNSITDITEDIPELPLKIDEENWHTYSDQQHNEYDFYDSYNFNNEDQKRNDNNIDEVRVIQSTKIIQPLYNQPPNEQCVEINNQPLPLYNQPPNEQYVEIDNQQSSNKPPDNQYAENENKIKQKKELDNSQVSNSNNKNFITGLSITGASIALASIIVGAAILTKSFKR
jgi:hypothetical protein